MKLLKISGIIIFLGSLILLKVKYNMFDVERNGEIVSMIIEKLPANCLGTKTNHYVTLSYNGEKFIKKIGGRFCHEHSVGQSIQVKYLEGNDSVLFMHESVIAELLSTVVLGLIGLIITIIQFRKK